LKPKLDMFFELLYNKSRERLFKTELIDFSDEYINPNETKKIEKDIFNNGLVQAVQIETLDEDDSISFRFIVNRKPVMFEEKITDHYYKLPNELFFSDGKLEIEVTNHKEKIVKFNKFQIKVVNLDEEIIHS